MTLCAISLWTNSGGADVDTPLTLTPPTPTTL